MPRTAYEKSIDDVYERIFAQLNDKHNTRSNMAKASRYTNVKCHMEGTLLTITVETDEDKVLVKPSASGKNMVIATTGGARVVGDESGVITPHELKLNLTLYRKA